MPETAAVVRLLELAGEHAREVLADTDQLVSAAEARAREIPKIPGVVRDLDAAWRIIGELIIRLAVAEAALDELLADCGRDPLRKRTHGGSGITFKATRPAWAQAIGPDWPGAPEQPSQPPHPGAQGGDGG
jgi:hypothetical protein